jgi:hypothetical protein
VSGEPRLEADTGDGGRFCVTGDLPGISASGGLLAVRRVADDQWLTSSGLCSSDRPQWFPFHCDEGTAGETWLEVRAAALLDLIASPPTGPLSARLRFVATARHDAFELDIDLRFPGAATASQGDVPPGEASDAYTEMSDPTTGDGPTAEAEPPASLEPHDKVVPRDGATASTGDLNIPPTEQQPDQSQKSRSDPVEPASAAAVIGSRTTDAADASLTNTATATLPTMRTDSPTDKVDIASESRPAPPPPEEEANASKRKDNPAQEPDLSAGAPVEVRASPPVVRNVGPAIDADNLPLSIWPTGSAVLGLEGEAPQVLDAQSNNAPIPKQLPWQRVVAVATILALAAIAVTWWWPHGAVPVVNENPTDEHGADCARAANQPHCPPPENDTGLPVPETILPELDTKSPVTETKMPELDAKSPVAETKLPELDAKSPEADTEPLEGGAAREQLEPYFESAPQGEPDCARTPNHSNCLSPEEDTKPPAADTTRQQLKDFFQ